MTQKQGPAWLGGHTPSRRAVVTAMAGLMAPALARAQPAAPIRILVGYAPGGTGDVMVRIVAERLRARFGHNIVIENRSGAAGTIAAQAVARAAPDGLTLLLGQTSEVAIGKTFTPAMMPYDPEKDLLPVVLIGNATLGLVVNEASPYRSVAELAAAARSKPGGVTYASSGTGTPGHFCGVVLGQMAGGSMVHVPYRGAGPALVDLLARQTDLFFSGLPAAIPHVREGRLRLLAVSTARRSGGAPETPTVAESFPGFDFSLWGGLFAPAGTPAEIVGRLNRQVNEVLAEPAVRDRLQQEGAEVIPNTPEEFGSFVRAEVAKYARVIQETGVKPD
jgi:tripartite-type tricarboxylate transporter receptor subunit TctC